MYASWRQESGALTRLSIRSIWAWSQGLFQTSTTSIELRLRSSLTSQPRPVRVTLQPWLCRQRNPERWNKKVARRSWWRKIENIDHCEMGVLLIGFPFCSKRPTISAKWPHTSQNTYDVISLLMTCQACGVQDCGGRETKLHHSVLSFSYFPTLIGVNLRPKALAQRICLKRSKNIFLRGSYLSFLGADLVPRI